MSMKDLDIAKSGLVGHTISLCKGDSLITSDKRGISQMMEFIAIGQDLQGYSVADVIVGKAAAMLFIKTGIVAVHAMTLSNGGLDILNSHNVPCTYDNLVDNIINRKGDDICPMEKTVLHIDDIEQGYLALLDTYTRLKSND